MYGLPGRAHLRIGAEFVAGIWVAVEARKVGRRNFDTDAVAFPEHVAGDTEVDFVFVDPVGFEQGRVGKAFAVSSTQDAVAEIFGVTRRGDIYELGRPVGVRAVGSGVEHGFDWSGDFHVGFQGSRGVTEHIAAHLDRALIVGPPGHDVRRAAVVATQGLDGVPRVIDEAVRGVSFWESGRQAPVAEQAVGTTAGMEVPFLPLSARQGPFVFIAPFVGAHDEEAQGRLVHDAVVDAFEPVVEPSQFQGL